MTIVADAIRAVLVPFLLVTGMVLVALVCYVLLLHAFKEIVFRRRQRLRVLYRPLVSAALQAPEASENLQRLDQLPRRHRPILAELLLEPLRVAKGSVTDRARAVADTLGFIAEWDSRLTHPRWWLRAEAAQTLGLLKCGAVIPALVRALDDPIDEVRAAAVEALGLIGDPAGIPDLIARLGQHSRYHRVRVVQALRQCGPAAVPLLLRHADGHRNELASIADLLGSIEAVGALPQLIGWCTDARAEVRAASVRAIGTIGVDERAYYHVLRALNDGDVNVRAVAAWALGRSGRDDATPYLAAHLQDEWLVAAQCAQALGCLGAPGRLLLERAAADERGELARHVLWECGAVSRG